MSIKIFDDKISDLEKRRGKNKSAKKNKPTTSKDKVIANVPLKFLKTVQIGEVTLPPMGFFEIKKADYHNGTPCTEKDYEHLGLYAKGIARFGSGDDALYFHYDANNGHYNGMISRFGSQDFKNTVEDFPGILGIVWHLKTNSGMKFYIIEHGDAAGFGSSCTLIGENKNGKFVKYFNTKEIKDRYLGERNHRGISDEWNKFTFQDNTIIIRYGQYESYDKFNAIGEFRFKWDDAAQWFGVEQVIYNQTATEQKNTQENQPMQFSQSIQIGEVFGDFNLGGFLFKQVNKNDGVLSSEQRLKNRSIYDHGIAVFGNGTDALYFHYDSYKANVQGKKINVITHGFMKFGDIDINNTVTLKLPMFTVFSIENNQNRKFYMINSYYDIPEDFHYALIGKTNNGKWAKYFDTGDIVTKYFGSGQGYGFEKFKLLNDTIIILYRLFYNGRYNNPTERGEFRFKWDDAAQWFSVEQVKY